MIRAAIGFFVLAVLSIFLGLGGVAGLSMDIAKTLLTVFLVLAAFSFLISLITGKKPKLH